MNTSFFFQESLFQNQFASYGLHLETYFVLGCLQKYELFRHKTQVGVSYPNPDH